MLKNLAVILGCACVTVVVCEAAALGLLWYRGRLSAHHLREMRIILAAEPPPARSEEPAVKQLPAPSPDEVAEIRALRILGFDRRADELGTLKQWVAEERSALSRDRAEFIKMRDSFTEQWRALQEGLASGALEQARGILAAMKPSQSVAHLMALTVEENVRLLRGMPEGVVARILQAFAEADQASPAAALAAGRESPAERGKRIFEALEQGEPSRGLLEQAPPGARTAGRDAPGAARQ